MAKLSNYELLSRVWSECTIDEILDFGLENDHISSSNVLEYADSFKTGDISDYSDEELEEIFNMADLKLVMEQLTKKYPISDIIDELDEDDILSCFDADKVFDYFEWDLDAIKEDERKNGYEEGYEEGYKDGQKPEPHPIKDGTIDDKWRFLCDEFDLTHYDNIGLFNKITKLLQSLNKSTYKDKNDKQWLAINVE